MKKSNRFISSAALTAKDVANKQSQAESNAGGRNISQEDLRSSDTATTKPMQKVAYWPIRRECSIGLASSRVTDHDNKQYCLERWDHCRGAWRSKMCLISTSNENKALDPKLWNQNNLLQCMKCFNANGNISFRRNSELFNDSVDSVDSNADPVGKVVDTFWRLDKEGDADETSKNDQVVVENMILLQSRGISSVDCGKGNKILICPGVDDMMGECQLIE
eukprot:scaffold76116_cov66-Attheya_sp.AAC.1